MKDLGNAAIDSRVGGSMKIARPKAVEDLLDLAVIAREEGRRVIFFCSCSEIRYCHRKRVGDLALKAAERRGLKLEVVEWPGGDPKDVDCPSIHVSEDIYKDILRGRKTIPLGGNDAKYLYASLPWGTILNVKSKGRNLPVSVEPARCDASGWALPIFLFDVEETDTSQLLKPYVREERKQRGLEPRLV